MNAVIQTDRLCKGYGSARGIADLSMTVERGEVFGFLGPNGAGKTTTIRTLLDLLHPTSGTARVFGLDSRRDSRAIRARLGNLPGDFAYDPRMTGRELLTFFAELRGLAGLGRAESLAARFKADLDRPLGRAVARQPPEDRPHPGGLPRARAARARRADERPRPADAGGVPRLRRRGARPRRHRLSLLARARRGRARLRSRRDRPRGPPRRRRGGRRDHRPRAAARHGSSSRSASIADEFRRIARRRSMSSTTGRRIPSRRRGRSRPGDQGRRARTA